MLTKYRISCCRIGWDVVLPSHFKMLTYASVKYFTPTFQFVLSLWPLRPFIASTYPVL